MPITQEQWTEIEAELTGMFPTVAFRWQGHELTIERRQISEGRSALIVFVDGSFNAVWGYNSVDGTCRPMVEQLWRKRTQSLYPPKFRAEMYKKLGKRGAKELIPNIDEVRQWRDPLFSSARSLVRQYKKLEGLALLKCGYSSEATSETPAA